MFAVGRPEVGPASGGGIGPPRQENHLDFRTLVGITAAHDRHAPDREGWNRQEIFRPPHRGWGLERRRVLSASCRQAGDRRPPWSPIRQTPARRPRLYQGPQTRAAAGGRRACALSWWNSTAWYAHRARSAPVKRVPQSAMPTTKASNRLTASNWASSTRPTGAPQRSRRTAMILSTITCDGWRSPVPSPAGSDNRYSGVSRSLVVSLQTKTLSVSGRKSDWITNAGRGLPQSPGRATVTRSPRLTPRRRSYSPPPQ